MANKEQTKREAMEDAYAYEDLYGDFAKPPPTEANEDEYIVCPLKPKPHAEVDPDGEFLDPNTETVRLLNKLIGECHYAMRAVALPTAYASRNMLTRQRFLGEARDIVEAAAVAGKTVAMLRASGRLLPNGLEAKVTKIFPAIEKNG